ncbi:MAG TPA: hypothetical protein V6C78_06605 [Crinalium sp.]|jgi:hypothetical protein
MSTQLIYRGETYDYTPSEPHPYRQPRAVNWRFQASGEVYGHVSVPVAVYRQPRAVNWRYQLVTE